MERKKTGPALRVLLFVQPKGKGFLLAEKRPRGILGGIKGITYVNTSLDSALYGKGYYPRLVCGGGTIRYNRRIPI